MSLEHGRGEWAFGKPSLTNELEVLTRSKDLLQKLRSVDLKKCVELVQELANVATQLTIWDEALKKIQSAL
jgi:hypothetical protein